MERTQLMTEKWKVAAQEMMEMVVAARDPEKLKGLPYAAFIHC